MLSACALWKSLIVSSPQPAQPPMELQGQLTEGGTQCMNEALQTPVLNSNQFYLTQL